MAARYEPYPEYQSTGLEWLGKVPSHWQIKRLGQFFEERREKVSDKDYQPLSVTMQGIVPRLENAAKTDAGDNRKLVKKNDFVINSRSDRKGSSGISQLDGSVSLISIVMTPKRIVPEYAHHLLRSYNFQEEFYRYGKGIVADLWSTNSSEMKNILIPSAPKAEQKQIADFLDYETARIDTLIDKQQQLIELLKEKRQAVISHAVTKGLNPDVPMKDSGVEWLGEVPEHWEVKRLKQVINEPLLYGANEAALDTNINNPRFIRITDVKDDGSLKEDTFRSLTEEVAKPYLLTEGDILLARTGGTVGKSFMYSESWGRCCFAGYLIKASLDQSRVKAEWLYQYTNTKYYWEWIASIQIQATLPNVSADKYNGFLMAIPPISEQYSIIDSLKTKVEHFNDIVEKADSAIELMQERRTALISAAVTGKIDVRNWKAPE